MASADSLKTCRSCFSEIDARARKCPRCHAFQGTLRNLLIFGPLIVFAILIGSALWFDFWAYRHTEYEGADYSSDIEIVSSQLYFTPKRDGKSVSIVGQLRNTGDVAVDLVRLEVRLLNKDGQLIDSYRDSISDHIEPGDGVSFRLSQWENIHLPEEDYAKHKVITRSAKRR